MKSNTLTKSQPRLKFQEFIVNNTAQGSACHIFIAQPTPLEEKNFGKLFLLLELTNFQNKADEIFTKIQKSIATNYYCAEEFIIEVAFENALQQTNQLLQNITAAYGDEWFKHFHAIIAIAKDQEVHITSAGKVQGFLIQNDRILDILQQENTHANVNPLKLFSSILSGNIREGDSMFFSTESILDFFSQEKIKRIIQENTTEEAIRNFTEILSQSQTHNFAGIIVKTESEVLSGTNFITGTKETLTDEVQDSMQSLIQKEQTTHELLTPSLWPKIKTNLSSFKEKNNQKYFTPAKQEDKKEEKKQSKQHIPPSMKRALLLIFEGCKKITSWITKGLSILLRSVWSLLQKDKVKRFPAKMVHFPQRTGGILARIILAFQRLSRPRKILLLLSIIFIVLFAQSIMHQGSKREEEKSLLEYETKIDDAAKKIDESKAALLYKNEEGARAFLIEAQTILASIPETISVYQEKVEPKKKEIQTQLNEINHIRNFDNEAQVVADFSSINANLSLGALMVLQDKFLVTDATNGTMYTAKEDENPEIFVENSETQDAIKTMTKNNDVLMGFTQGAALKNIDLEKKTLTDVQVEFSTSEKQASDLNFYGGRLYVLDAEKNQIQKHIKTASGFGKGENWISDTNVDIRDAVSIAIDGAIYVLKKDGTIIKLFAGNKDPEFKQFAMEPKFSEARKITTLEEGKNIYILDGKNRRIVILTKEGQLVGQYISERFTDIRDFAISNDEKILYFLNNVQLYRVSISQ